MTRGKTMRSYLSRILFIALFLSLSFYRAEAATSDWFYISFDTPTVTYSLPQGYSYTQHSGIWIDLGGGNGAMQFQGGSPTADRGHGYYNPSEDVTNFTFTIRFMHHKNNDWDEELVAGFWDSEPLPFPPIKKILILLEDTTTDNPSLVLYMEENYNEPLAHVFSPIQNYVWYTLMVTFDNVGGGYYAYLNGNIWARGNFTLDDCFFDTTEVYDFSVGAWYRTPRWENYFEGLIDYIRFTDEYTPPWVAQDVMLWYDMNEGDGTVLWDKSGGNFHGTVDNTMYGWSDDAPFGYSLSGTLTADVKFGVDLPAHIPSITDRFSSSFWFKFVSAAGSTGYTELVYLKPYRLRVQHSSSGGGWFIFELGSNIGGSTYYVTSDQYSRDIASNNGWFYVYASYDQTELRLTLVHTNGTVCYNSSTACAGEITDYAVRDGDDNYGFHYRDAGPGNLATRIDEFKLIKIVYGPYELNETGIGPLQNVTTVQGGINASYWFSASIDPNFITCDPDGKATLYVNSSGSWLINLTSATLTDFFTITPSMAAIEGLPYVSFAQISVQFSAKENTTWGYYYGNFLFQLQDSPLLYQQEVPFTLYIPEDVPKKNKTAEWYIDLLNEPLTLTWDTAISGNVSAVCRSNSSTYLNVESVAFSYSIHTKIGYNDTFVSMYYTEHTTNLQYNYWGELVETSVWVLHYGIDENVQLYGNFTIRHYVNFSNVIDPNEWTMKIITIYIRSPTVTKKLWGTLSVDPVVGYTGEVHETYLYVYSNYVTSVTWHIKQPGSGWEITYIHVTGSPAAGEAFAPNASVLLQVKLPDAVGLYNCTIHIQDLRDPSMFNTTILHTDSQGPPGVDFTFVVRPDEIHLDPSLDVLYFWAYGQISGPVSRTYYMNDRHNCTGLILSYPNPVGTGTDFRFDIKVEADPLRIVNGSYLIEFVAYYVNETGGMPYRSDTIVLVVTGSSISEIITDRVTPEPVANVTTIDTTFGIPVYGIGDNMKSILGTLMSSIGFPYPVAAFLFGLLIFVLVVIGTSRATRSNMALLLVALPTVFMNIMLGIWPAWIMVVITLFGIAMLSLKIGQWVGGRGGGGGGEGAEEI